MTHDCQAFRLRNFQVSLDLVELVPCQLRDGEGQIAQGRCHGPSPLFKIELKSCEIPGFTFTPFTIIHGRIHKCHSNLEIFRSRNSRSFHAHHLLFHGLFTVFHGSNVHCQMQLHNYLNGSHVKLHILPLISAKLN